MSSDKTDHGPFIALAQNFKSQLEAAGFNQEEVTAMLGSFVLASYQQQFTTQYPPEFYEMMTKQNLLNERILAEEAEEE